MISIDRSIHSFVICCFSWRYVSTCSLVLCLVHDHVYSHEICIQHEYNYIIYILCITKSEFIFKTRRITAWTRASLLENTTRRASPNTSFVFWSISACSITAQCTRACFLFFNRVQALCLWHALSIRPNKEESELSRRRGSLCRLNTVSSSTNDLSNV